MVIGVFSVGEQYGYCNHRFSNVLVSIYLVMSEVNQAVKSINTEAKCVYKECVNRLKNCSFLDHSGLQGDQVRDCFLSIAILNIRVATLIVANKNRIIAKVVDSVGHSILQDAINVCVANEIMATKIYYMDAAIKDPMCAFEPSEWWPYAPNNVGTNPKLLKKWWQDVVAYNKRVNLCVSKCLKSAQHIDSDVDSCVDGGLLALKAVSVKSSFYDSNLLFWEEVRAPLKNHWWQVCPEVSVDGNPISILAKCDIPLCDGYVSSWISQCVEVAYKNFVLKTLSTPQRYV